jgi:hypothetical protein
MVGVLLMGGGIVAFLIGLYIYKSSNTEKRLSKINASFSLPATAPNVKVVESKKKAEVVKKHENIYKVPENQHLQSLEKVIEMAIADGVLTANEKKVIKRIAEENNLNYEQIIKDVEARILASDFDSETALININKKSGDDFEKFVVQKFSKKYFQIKEWAGDKYVNGRYAQTTQNPDLLIEFRLGESNYDFAVECKWRKDIKEKGIEFANAAQFKRYKDFEVKREVPVFIAIGVGGKASMPEKLYIVPLRMLTSNFIFPNTLEKFEKKDTKGFFYDYKNKALR